MERGWSSVSTEVLLRLGVLSLLLLGGHSVNWPLTGYQECGSKSLEYSSAVSRSASSGGIALDSTSDVLWTAVNGTVYKFSYSTGSLLNSFNFELSGTSNRRLLQSTMPTLDVCVMEGDRVAVVDKQSKYIYILDVAAGTVTRQIPLSFVPRSITYDGAYEVFYVTNAEEKTSDSVGTAAPGRMVIRVALDGGTRDLFRADSSYLGDKQVSSMHYASNTGTLFLLCSSCPSVVEVTLSGRLRSLTQSLLDLEAGAGQLLGLTISKMGSPLLLLRNDLSIAEYCQDIPPSLPVLPPPRASVPRPQSWFPLENYAFCGASQYEGISNSGMELRTMALDSSLRTMWAMVGSDLREFDFRGALLRTVSAAALRGLGISNVTSLAWQKRNVLLLGMAEGNRIATLSTAPKSLMDEIPRLYAIQEGLPLGDPNLQLEPPGLDAEQDIIRKANQVELVRVVTIGSEQAAPNSLEAITVNRLMKQIYFVTSDEPGRVKAVSLEGEPAEDLAAGLPTPADLVGFLAYSQNQDRFLQWEGFGANLFEISRDPPEVNSTRQFDSFITSPGERSSASGFAITPDGAVLMIATRFGEVNFFCGKSTVGDNEIIDRVRSGDDSDIDANYYWRLQQLIDEGGAQSAAGRTRGFADDSFRILFGIRCSDPSYNALPNIDEAAACEALCSRDINCGGYAFNFNTKLCALQYTCNSRVFSLSHISGVRSVPAPPPPQPPPPPPTEGPTYINLPDLSCTDPSLRTIPQVDRALCQKLCTADSACGAYTHLASSRDCNLKAQCTLLEFIAGAFTARKNRTTEEQPQTPAPTQPPGQEGYIMIEGIGCKDPTLETIRDTTQAECESRCNALEACGAYTFNIRNDCFLKENCFDAQGEDVDVSYYLPGRGPDSAPTSAPAPGPITGPGTGPDIPVTPGGQLIGGWEWRDDEDCEPWEDRKCGISDNPGLRVGDVTWYRMFAHKANPLVDKGNGVMEWTPYRARKTYGAMYYKGSEIIGYFDNHWDVSSVGDEATVSFLWSSEGEVQDEICGDGPAKGFDCEDCGEEFDDETGDRYIYHEVRCYSGTGDFRIALLDTTEGERITNDGYGYFNEKVRYYKGLQWRFHPNACPEEARAHPFGYVAVAGQSWIRDEIHDEGLNYASLIIDYIEKDRSDDWYEELGETRSFSDRLLGPSDVSMSHFRCLSVPLFLVWAPNTFTSPLCRTVLALIFPMGSLHPRTNH
mmetsp:Transcript_28817/g.68805  ORF Transcript_28817/g.68805 Transcript_28817/m.68805 type:complete len:1219 (+) Transcript_28817:166-3822(+)